MKTQSSHWWTTAFHVEWIVLFMILLLGGFLVSPGNLWASPRMAIYALIVTVTTYFLVRLLHRGTTGHG